MADLPTQGLLQQLHARPMSGEALEVLGKRASARWGAGDYPSLTEAVTETVKHAHLAPEQVKRVLEFTNTSAFLTEFERNKEASPHKVIEFEHGPADLNAVLADLNDGGGGARYDSGTEDYCSPPMSKAAMVENAHGVKTAGADDRALAEAFSQRYEENIPYANPYGEVVELRDKLAGATSHLTGELGGLEMMYEELSDRLFQRVKQASLDHGVSLSQVVRAWETVAPDHDYVKVAFTVITPRLLENGVFSGIEAMNASLDKTASAGALNMEHPLVVDFNEFCQVLTKMAESRVERDEMRMHLDDLTNYLKTAASEPSTLMKSYRAVNGAAEGVSKAIQPALAKHLGAPGHVLARGVAWAPHVAAGIGALEAKRWVDNSPSGVAGGIRGTGNLVMRNIPGTQQNLMEQYRIQGGG